MPEEGVKKTSQDDVKANMPEDDQDNEDGLREDKEGAEENGLATFPEIPLEKPVVKYDADSASCVTYLTDNGSLQIAPSTINTIASSKLEMQLNFLAKQLELER